MTVIRMRRVAALLVAAGLALLISAGTAAAHNRLIASDPPEGASLASGPARVSLTFDLPVQPGFTTVTVTGPDGNQWQAGAPTEDGAVVSVPVRPLGPAGEYLIAYQVLGADGHPVQGTVRYILTTPGTSTPAGTGTPAPQDSGASAPEHTSHTTGGTPVWPFLAGVGVLLAAGVVVALRIGRSRT
ncbi:MAG: copper resistance CopC family protein [Pseudonocardiales bacterium]